MEHGTRNTISKNVQRQGLPHEFITAGSQEPGLQRVSETRNIGSAAVRRHPDLHALHRLAEDVLLPRCGDGESVSDMRPSAALVALPAESRRAGQTCGSRADRTTDARIDLHCGTQLGLLNRYDPVLAASMVADYLSDTSILLWEIGDIPMLPSWHRLGEITASLRASSQCLGAVGLAVLFGCLEQAVERQDLIEFIHVFDRVLDAFPAVSESLLVLVED